MSIKEKARENLKKVIAKFKKVNGSFLFYDMNNEKFRPLVIAENEETVKERMNEKIQSNPSKYKDSKLVRVFIQTDLSDIGRKEYNAPGIGGALGISVMYYFITAKNKVHSNTSDPFAKFWYTDKQIAKRKFSLDDVQLAIRAILEHKVEFNPFATHYIDELDTMFKKKNKTKKDSVK